MSQSVVGVIGHVDHGKSALVAALTGSATDRLPEEQARGLTIALGFAHLAAAPGTMVDLIDMPGHERFVRTMIAGATGIDAVLLVVAANEGVAPQTVEHVDIAGLLGIAHAAVAVTKTDLVTAGAAQAVADDAEALLRAAGIAPLPPVMVSARNGTGIAALRDALAALASGRRVRAADGIAFLPIDRAFAVPGHGPVVTGTLRGAGIAADDELVVLPAGHRVRVRSVQVHGEPVAAAAPGRRVAVNLRGVAIADLARGMALAPPDTLAASDWLTIAIGAVAGAPPLKNGRRLRALLGTQELEVRLRLLDRDVLGPGETGFAQLHLAAPVSVPAGERIVLRIASPALTVAGGPILEAVTRRRRRNDAAGLARLAELRDRAPAAIVAAEVARAARTATTVRGLSQVTGLAAWRLGELLADMPVVVARSGLVVPRATLDALTARLPALLAPAVAGLSRQGIAAALPDVDAAIVDEVLARLIAAAAVRRLGSRFVVARPDDERARVRGAAELGERIAERLRLAGLAPPTPREIVTDAAADRAVERLLRTGVVVRAVDRAKGKEMLFHRDAIALARRTLAPLLAPEPGLPVSDIAAALGISRKFVMPLLDHLDAGRFTRRIGDRRRLWQIDDDGPRIDAPSRPVTLVERSRT